MRSSHRSLEWRELRAQNGGCNPLEEGATPSLASISSPVDLAPRLRTLVAEVRFFPKRPRACPGGSRRGSSKLDGLGSIPSRRTFPPVDGLGPPKPEEQVRLLPGTLDLFSLPVDGRRFTKPTKQVRLLPERPRLARGVAAGQAGTPVRSHKPDLSRSTREPATTKPLAAGGASDRAPARGGSLPYKPEHGSLP